jgi:hypothetical protein
LARISWRSFWCPAKLRSPLSPIYDPQSSTDRWQEPVHQAPHVTAAWGICGSKTPHWIPHQLLRRPFALRGGAPSGAPGPRRCCRSEPRHEPTRTQAHTWPPAPSGLPGGPCPERGAPLGPPRGRQKSAPRVRCAYRGDCGWMDRVPQSAGGVVPTARRRQEGPTGAVEFCRHGPFFGWEVVTARAASFLEEEASWGFTRLHHNVQPSDQGRHGQPINLRWHRAR